MTPRMSSSREDQMLLAVELDLSAGGLAEQYPVAGLHAERQDLAVLRLTGTARHHVSFGPFTRRGEGDANPWS
jgi:hypothetical protein